MTELFYRFAPDCYLQSQQILFQALKSELYGIIEQLDGVVMCDGIPVKNRIRSTHIPGHPTIVMLRINGRTVQCKYDRTDSSWCEVLDEDLPEIYLRLFEFLHKNYELKGYGY